MITSKKETKKRLEIVDYISNQIKPYVKCIVLGGSMGYGQNLSVAPWCDIDMVIVIDKENVEQLMRTPYFNQTTPEKVVKLFVDEKIHFFWVSRLVSGVQVDIFVYNPKPFALFCTLQGNLKGFLKTKPEIYQEGYDFSGKKIRVDREVEPFENGYIFSKPSLQKGVYWGGVPRDDFLFMNYIVYEKDKFYTTLTNEVWISLIKQLIKESKHEVNLDKNSIINTIFTYQTNRQGMSQKTIEKIKSKTEELLKIYS
ncbi:hypothetical protein J4438_02755 [Candidatus Woesearchaeota archaeon]|nr:hypothetical protein [Candidatus Woesearchaeota archaeon]